MGETVSRISLTQPAPIQIDSTEPEVIEAALRADPRPRDRQLDQPRGRARQARPDRAARAQARRGPDRADDRRGRDGEDRRAQARDRQADPRARLRRARARSRAADLRRAHLHADDGRGGVAALGGRDDRGDPADQGGAAGRQDVARRLQRLLRDLASRRARCSTPSSCTTASRPGLDLAMVNPNHITPYGEISEEERELADDLVFDRSEDALERFIEHFESKGPEEQVSAADATEGMEPEEALHFHILRRKKDGVEDWIDRSVEKIGAVPTLNGVLLPAMKEVGDKFGAGELILPFVLQSAEVMKRAVAQPRELPRPDRGPHEGHRRDRDGLRRRPRHRQVARQHDPDQQRLHGRRPRQAGPDRADHRRRRRARGRRDRPLRAARLDLEADARLHRRAARARPRASRC